VIYEIAIDLADKKLYRFMSSRTRILFQSNHYTSRHTANSSNLIAEAFLCSKFVAIVSVIEKDYPNINYFKEVT